MTRRRRFFFRLILMISMVGLALAWILSDAPARFLILEDPPIVVDALVVFAGDPDYERTTTAARILLSGRARVLILTGGEPGPGDSADSLRGWALKQGVPAEKIQTETRSHSTREAVVAVKPILREIDAHRVGLVTSPYHLRRAFLSARRSWSGVAISNWPARPSWWSAHRWWRHRKTRATVVSEYLKLGYYSLRGWI
jgi:uncharacterized SAM-binding protein YcdF (DUF218 family)